MGFGQMFSWWHRRGAPENRDDDRDALAHAPSHLTNQGRPTKPEASVAGDAPGSERKLGAAQVEIVRLRQELAKAQGKARSLRIALEKSERASADLEDALRSAHEQCHDLSGRLSERSTACHTLGAQLEISKQQAAAATELVAQGRVAFDFVHFWGLADASFTAAALQAIIDDRLLPSTEGVVKALRAAARAGLIDPAKLGDICTGAVAAVAEGESTGKLRRLTLRHHLFNILEGNVWDATASGAQHLAGRVPPFALKHLLLQLVAAAAALPSSNGVTALEDDALDAVNRYLDGHRLMCRHFFNIYNQTPAFLEGILQEPADAVTQYILGSLQAQPEICAGDAAAAGAADGAAAAAQLRASVAQLLASAVLCRLCVEAAHPAMRVFVGAALGTPFDAASMLLADDPFQGACVSAAAADNVHEAPPAAPGTADPANDDGFVGGGEHPPAATPAAGEASSAPPQGEVTVLCVAKPGVRLDAVLMAPISGVGGEEQRQKVLAAVVIKQAVLARQ